MALNPNYPVIDYAVSWAAGRAQAPVQPYWCSVLERTQDQASTRRGKQYELDQVQPGEMNLSLANKDGALDLMNTASPYAPYVIPYRLIRMREQWPPTQNLLTQNQATSGEATALPNSPHVEPPWTVGAAPDANSVWQNPFTPTTVVTDSSAFQGANVLQVAFPAGGAYPAFVLAMRNFSVAAGLPHTFTARARSKTASISASAQLQIAWVNAAGAVLSSVNGAAVALAAGASASWATLTVTATAPANATGAVVNLTAVSGPVTAWLLQCDGWQYERAAAATAFTVPGVWYPAFTGYVERWPQRWTSSGNYGVSDIVAVDLFAYLSQQGMLAPFVADLMALNPNFLYALNETAGTSSFVDFTGNRDPLLSNVSSSPAFVNISAGASPASSDNTPPGFNGGALTGAFLGASGPVMAGLYTDPPSGIVAGTGWDSQLATPKSVGVPAVGTAWSRLMAVRGGPGSTGLLTSVSLMQVVNNDQTSGIFIDGTATTDGGATYTLEARVFAASVLQSSLTFPGLNRLLSSSGTSAGLPFIDSDWHLIGISLSSDGKTLSTWCDASSAPNVATGTTPVAFAAGAALYEGYFREWTGQAAFVCELPRAMDGVTWLNLYQSWRNAWAATGAHNETSDGRYARILAWLNFGGPSRVSNGLSRAYGPAVDLNSSGTGTTYALTALQSVVETESGQHFIGADGAAVFQSRNDRYNKTPVLVFGEHTAAGEIPYLGDVGFDYDPTRVGNDVQVTAQYGNSLYRAQDGPPSDPTTSQGKYGTITLQRTVNSLDPFELTAAAQALLYLNKDPQVRLKSVSVDPSSYPAAWPALLGLELGACVKVWRRPASAPAFSVTGFVEQIAWSIDARTKKTLCTLQISSNARKQVAQYNTSVYNPDTGSMTLQAGITATATTLVIATAAGSPTASTAAGSYPVSVQLDSEVITLTAPPSGSTSPQTFSGVTRGTAGTIAATHAAGAVLTVATVGRWAY